MKKLKKSTLPILFTFVLSLFLSAWYPMKPAWAWQVTPPTRFLNLSHKYDDIYQPKIWQKWTSQERAWDTVLIGTVEEEATRSSGLDKLTLMESLNGSTLKPVETMTAIQKCIKNAATNFPKGDKQEHIRLCNGISPDGWINNNMPYSVLNGDGGGTTDGKGKGFSPY